jgi:hypothetical protein
MGDLSHFERGQIVGRRLAKVFLIKTATLLGVSRVTVSKVMLADTNHGKTTSVKRNSGRKSTLTETDRRTNIHLEVIVSTKKLSDMNFTNPTSTVRLQLLKL